MLDSILRRDLKHRDIRLKDSSLTALKEKCAAVADTAVAFEDMRTGENAMDTSTEVELPDGQKVSIATEGCATIFHTRLRSCWLYLHGIVPLAMVILKIWNEHIPLVCARSIFCQKLHISKCASMNK